jgi:predicted SnoaL-like aldol condensation-catalyzing enzyme
MKMTALIPAVCALMLAGTVLAAEPSLPERNREVVLRFYNALVQGDVNTLQALGRPDYIQHNPNFETGLDGLINAVKSRPPRSTAAPAIPPLQFVRVIADTELVMTLRRAPVSAGAGQPENPAAERAVVDIFRVQDGKVAEHWDYMETFPRGATAPKNSNGRF